MKGWIIYNGALKLKKVEILVHRMVEISQNMNLELHKVKNNQIIPIIKDGKPHLIKTLTIPEPDFIIFWDKDIPLAKHLQAMGYKLYNNAKSIEICDDKSLMHAHLAGKVPMPDTIIGPFVFRQQKLTKKYLNEITKTLGEELIIKECKGSWGMQVYKENGIDNINKRLESLGSIPFIAQRFVKESLGRDIRVNIVGDKIIGAMERVNQDDFRANITLGASSKPIKLSIEQEKLALKAHKLLGLTFSGVDLLYGANGPLLCEVNSNVNFQSFEQTTGINFGKLILEHVISDYELRNNL